MKLCFYVLFWSCFGLYTGNVMKLCFMYYFEVVLVRIRAMPWNCVFMYYFEVVWFVYGRCHETVFLCIILKLYDLYTGNVMKLCFNVLFWSYFGSYTGNAMKLCFYVLFWSCMICIRAMSWNCVTGKLNKTNQNWILWVLQILLQY